VHRAMNVDPANVNPARARSESILSFGKISVAPVGSTPPSRRTRWAVFSLVALLGLALRLPHLSGRPMHTDEAVNAYIVGQLLAGRTFTYDSEDRHGPALAALALPLVRMQGARTFSDLTESELRLTTVLAGTVTILLFGVNSETFGFVPSVIAALLFAGASLPVYYDRYFIHESLFTAATFGLILTASRRGSLTQAALAGCCAALMLASKETAVVHFFALAAAALCFWLWNLRAKSLSGFWRWQAIVTGAAIFLVLTVVLYTWFGSNWKGLAALLHAIPNFARRAAGEGHQKPFWYYGELLAGGWSGGIVLALALVGCFRSLKGREPSPYGIVAFYAVFLAAIYSAIPYKTPWLALNLWLPIALLAGMALESLWRMPARSPAPLKSISTFYIFLGLILAATIAHDTVQRVFAHPSEETNPYAYAHTSEDLLGLPAVIEELARQGAITAPRIAVIAADPWPLPWYLRHFTQTGFWQPGQQPGKADFYITSSDAADEYRDQLKDFHADFFGVRPGVLILLWSPVPK
jgi:uncharacterized protein (TIGR03663 family)